MDLATQRLMQAAAGGGDKVYVDDVFSTYIYNANQGNYINVNNGIDLAGEGGLVWGKRRDYSEDHVLCDTERGPLKYLSTSNTSAQNTSHGFSAYNSNGFTVNNASRGAVNQGSGVYCTWTFRKAPGFFDVVTYTGNGSNRTIAHSLGSVPGMILIRRYDGAGEWMVYHVGNVKAGNGSAITGHTAKLRMDDNSSASSSSTTFNNTAPTSSVFSLGTEEWVNENGYEFVAYIFGNNDQSFGEGGNEEIIKCGNWTGDNSYSKDITLGFEPQWLMVKNASGGTTWTITDSLRGIPTETAGKITQLAPSFQYSEAQFDSNEGNMEINLHANGFTLKDNSSVWNSNNENYIYVAIRRPDGYVGKPPELGTGVFAMDTGNGSYTIPAFNSGFPVDFAFYRGVSSAHDWNTSARLMSGKFVKTNTDQAEGTASSFKFSSNDGFGDGGNAMPSGDQAWMWKRHAGMDVVAYTGNGVAGRQVPHGLNAVPEMMWVKRRTNGSGGTNWLVYHKGLNGGSSPEDYYLLLNGSSAETATTAIWNDTAPTSTNFTVGNNSNVNSTDKETIAILFASVAGISKLGSYTGNATDSDPTSGTNTITFGFQPRMVIIKSYDASNTSWHILDTLRGWTTGDSTKRLRLNLTNAQSTEPYGYPTSTGMVLTGNGDGHLNNSGDNYIYYAHA